MSEEGFPEEKKMYSQGIHRLSETGSHQLLHVHVCFIMMSPQDAFPPYCFSDTCQSIFFPQVERVPVPRTGFERSLEIMDITHHKHA